jgi:hypothetical protein
MKYTITSRFGDAEKFRGNHAHTGIDFFMKEGESLRAVESGVIHLKDFGDTNAGKTVLIETEDGRTLIYGHLSKFANIKEGQHVSEGDLIGYSGHSGFTVGHTGDHLHFGMKKGGEFLNPSQYIDKIQHMNDTVTHQVADKINFFDSMQQHMNVLTDMAKHSTINLIQFFSSTDYTPFIKFFENVLQFIFFNV